MVARESKSVSIDKLSEFISCAVNARFQVCLTSPVDSNIPDVFMVVWLSRNLFRSESVVGFRQQDLKKLLKGENEGIHKFCAHKKI